MNRGTFGFSRKAVTLSCGGGTISYYQSFKVHKFTSNGSFYVYDPGYVNIAIIAGGGGGGSGYAGGGGGGGVLLLLNYLIPANVYSVVIGSGGPGHTADGAGTVGNNSSFGSLIARGGGGGAGWAANATNGGSGGGYGGNSKARGYAIQTNPGGVATSFLGNHGGSGATSGGGGAEGIGNILGARYGGKGIRILDNTYAGGGGGGVSAGGVAGVGQDGGSNGGVAANAPHAPANRGGGGGGGGGGAAYDGGNGGSGIVIIWYPNRD